MPGTSKNDPLAHVRGAIRGWELTDVGSLKRKVDRAETERDKLPASLRSAAEQIIIPARRELRRYV